MLSSELDQRIEQLCAQLREKAVGKMKRGGGLAWVYGGPGMTEHANGEPGTTGGRAEAGRPKESWGGVESGLLPATGQ